MVDVMRGNHPFRVICRFVTPVELDGSSRDRRPQRRTSQHSPKHGGGAILQTVDVSELDTFANLVPLDHGLAVISTTRADGTIQSSVVNTGVIKHPLRDTPVVAFVAAGTSQRLHNLRARPRATVVLRAGWQWAGVEGLVELAGPDDHLEGISHERLRVLLRDIFTAAGGTHDDWDEYDRVMDRERRVAVLIDPLRIYGNS
jgi:PPOX class probable F420-dependent enzyme